MTGREQGQWLRNQVLWLTGCVISRPVSCHPLIKLSCAFLVLLFLFPSCLSALGADHRCCRTALYRVEQSVGPCALAEEGCGNQREETHLPGIHWGLSAVRCGGWAQGYAGFTWEVLTLLTEFGLQLHENFMLRLIHVGQQCRWLWNVNFFSELLHSGVICKWSELCLFCFSSPRSHLLKTNPETKVKLFHGLSSLPGCC